MGAAVEVSARRSPGGPRRPWVLSAAVALWLLALPGASLAASGESRWVQERVVYGDRLAEIAERHGVSVSALIRWNKLDKKRPRIRAGKSLRIKTVLDPPPRRKVLYTVKRGDSWAKIAKAHDVERKHLRNRWNRKRRKTYLKSGEQLVLWIAAEPPPPAAGPPPPDSDLPIVSVPTTSISVGRADRGRLLGGLQLPKNDALYTRRNPAQSYGSSHTIMQLQTAVARFRRDSGYAGELVVKDLSRRRGGRFRPHRSHRTGRDVDIRLPLRKGIAAGTVPQSTSMVDWPATWKLMRALIDTGHVRYIFLSRARQRSLHRAAQKLGESSERLAKTLEFPARGGKALIRHSRGHRTHFHVRFSCAKWEKRCRD